MDNVFIFYCGYTALGRSSCLRLAKVNAVKLSADKIVEYQFVGGLYNQKLNPVRIYMQADWGARNWTLANLEEIILKHIK